MRPTINNDPPPRRPDASRPTAAVPPDPDCPVPATPARVVFLVALLLRAAWGTYRFITAEQAGTLEFPDEEQYWLIASNLWSHGQCLDEFGFRATRMPVFTALLAPFTAFEYGTAYFKATQWFVASLIPALVLVTAWRNFGATCGWLAGFAVAFDPFQIFFSSLILTETWFTLLFTLTWTQAIRLTLHPRPTWNGWLWFGIACCGAVYLRETGLVLCALLALAIPLLRPVGSRRWFAGSLLAAVVVVGGLLPWAARNRVVLGEWVFLTTRGGVSLYDGVRPGADGSSRLENVQRSEETLPMGELAWHRHFQRESRKAITQEPGRIARLAVVKLKRMWNPIPNVSTYQNAAIRIISGIWMIPLYLLFFIGTIMLTAGRAGTAGKATIWLTWLPIIGLCFVHALFVGSVRYRLPVMPMVEMVAAIAAVKLVWSTGTAKPEPTDNG